MIKEFNTTEKNLRKAIMESISEVVGLNEWTEEGNKFEDILLIASNDHEIYKELDWLYKAIMKKVRRGVEFDYDKLVDCSVMRRIQQDAIRNINKIQKEYDLPLAFPSNEDKREIRKEFADKIVEWMEYEKNNPKNIDL